MHAIVSDKPDPKRPQLPSTAPPTRDHQSATVGAGGGRSSVAVDPKGGCVPVKVLIAAGLDPSGGAGLCADIATVTALGAHPLPIITCQTVQDGSRFDGLESVALDISCRQFELIANRLRPDAVKLGLMPNPSTAQQFGRLLGQLPDVPVVFDPVLAAGHCGNPMPAPGTIEALCEHIIPHCRLLTPNRHEALQIGGGADIDEAAQHILALGCQYVLITSAHVHKDTLTHLLYHKLGAPECLEISSRIRAGNFHGSGCTLSAAVAVACANGLAMADAVAQAITYTEACIDRAWTAHPGVHFMRWHPHGKP